MTDDRTLDLLNRLFAAESTSLLPRLMELNPFASAGSARHYELIKRIAHESREHCQWLVSAIELEGGSVRPVSPDPRSGNLHYLSIDALLPLTRRSLQELVAVYTQASQERVSDTAQDLISTALARYRLAAEQLRGEQAANPV